MDQSVAVSFDKEMNDIDTIPVSEISFRGINTARVHVLSVRPGDTTRVTIQNIF